MGYSRGADANYTDYGRAGPPRTCYYCGTEGCTTRYCRAANDDVREGLVIRDPIRNQITLPNREEIPDDGSGACLREQAHRWHDTHPGQKT